MSRGLRNWAAAATALAMLATSAPAMAESEKYDARANAPAMVDVMILRPMGFVALATGTALFAAISPIMLITRPHEINKPWNALVAAPALYVWRDPIGSH